jgi:DNA repair exonuclease SbcCD ATPase subunit
MNLGQMIRQHEQGVVGLRAELDVVIEQMEEKTADAAQKLREYQRRKIETEAILDAAGYSFIEAEKLLTRLGALTSRLAALRSEQKKLDRISLSLGGREPAQLGEAKEKLQHIGDELHEMRLNRGWCKQTAGAGLQG